MSYLDLPRDLAKHPLHDDGVAADVIDLIVGPDDRERGCVALMLCDDRAVGVRPVLIADVPPHAGPGPVLTLLDRILPGVARDGGMVLFGRGRPGGVLLTDTDRRFHQAVIDACRSHGVPLIGAFLATPAAVRPFPPDLRVVT